MNTKRKIIHFDLDAFFCSVEELRQPELRGKPFAVGGLPGQRGVISSCSYAARDKGVRSAMPSARALRLCPQLTIIKSNHKQYEMASDRVMLILGDISPLIEQVSIDEAFLDVSDLRESGEEIARTIQSTIHAKEKLPCSLGVATNKLVAKIATDFGKATHKGLEPPNAITVVAPGDERKFLAPLTVQHLWGVGPKTTSKLNLIGVKTIGDLATLPEQLLVREFGKSGVELLARAQGIDNNPVTITHEIKSISQEVTFAKDVIDRNIIYKTLGELSAKIGFGLRQKGLSARVIRIKVRWHDFTTFSRQISIRDPVNQDQVICSLSIKLLDDAWKDKQPIRLIGLAAGNLTGKSAQPGLWETAPEKEGRLLNALDQIQHKYGKKIVQKGRLRDN